MKRSKLLLVFAIVAILALMFVACDETDVQPEHTHVYGGWTLTQAPTATVTGTATKECSCGDVVTETVAVLTNATVWTVDNNGVDASHNNAGVAIYKSVYGTVSVAIAQGQHSYGQWTIVQEPTLSEDGTAQKECACGDIVLETIADLADTSVWTVAHNGATHVATGSDVYTSVYGTVTIEIAMDEHTYGDWTSNGNGTHTHTCTEQDGGEETEACVYDKQVASNANLATPATCTTQATYYYTCECGAKGSQTFAYGIVTGHTIGEMTITKEPTCTEDGTVAYECTICHEPVENGVLAATGHVWSTNYVAIVEDEESTHHAKYCTVCDVVDEDHKATHNMVVGDAFIREVSGSHCVYKPQTCADCGQEGEDALVGTGTLESSWTEESRIPADYNQAGSVTYSYNAGGIENITIVLEKLVAPYDNQVYQYINVERNNEIGAGASRTYAMSGTIVGGITMVDATTGAVTVQLSSGTIANGFVDFETGIIVIQDGENFDNVYVLTSLTDDADADDIKSSYWFGGMAITYNYVCNANHTHAQNIFVMGNKVYFDVDFVDFDGNPISAEVAYNAQYVKIMQGADKVVAYANNGTALVETDGLEGVYTADSNPDIIIDGVGGFKAEIDGETFTGTYEAVEGEDYYDVYIYQDGIEGAIQYSQVTLSGSNYTMVTPTVTITFDVNNDESSATYEPSEYNVNIEETLPVLEDTTSKVFIGWYKQGDANETIVTTIVPTEAATYVAKWGNKVAINVIDTKPGNSTPAVVYIAEGETYGTYFEQFENDDVARMQFVGWFVDGAEGTVGAWDEADIALPLDAEITTDDAGVTVIAYWKEYPAYYGTYLGSNIYGSSESISGGGNFGKNLTIGFDGTATGSGGGLDGKKIVVAEDGFVTYGTNYIGFFNKDIKVLLTGYNGKSSLTNDCDIYIQVESGQTVTCNATTDAFQLNSGKTKYLRFHIGETSVMLMVDVNDGASPAVYTIETSEELAKMTDLKNGCVVTQTAVDGTVTKYAWADGSFKALDGFEGTYTLADNADLVLSGAGKFVWGEKSGVYVHGEGTAFALYVQNADGETVEYYDATIDQGAYTATKTMVDVTYNLNGVTLTSTAFDLVNNVNANVAITLPTGLTADGYVFRGWYTTDETVLLGATYVPTATVTINAKWDVQYSISINYNGAEGYTDTTLYYGAGDVSEIETPARADMAFGGWYTTADFQEGTEWTNGAVNATVAIYAKWNNPPFYAGTYTVFELSGSQTNGSTLGNSHWDEIFTINPDGVGTTEESYPAYPISANFTVDSYDAETGIIIFKNTSSRYIKFYADPTTGILVGFRSNGTNKDTVLAGSAQNTATATYNTILFVPMADGTDATAYSVVGSYWTTGRNRVLTVDVNGTSVNIYYVANKTEGDKVYFGAQYKAENNVAGADVVAADAYNAAGLYIFDNAGALVEQWGYNGTTMVALDGYQGTYTGAGDNVVLNGVDSFTMGAITGTYTLTEEGAEYTADVYTIEGDIQVYYQLTLDGTTYTLVKPEVTITYVSAHTTVPQATVNMNVEYALPAQEFEGYVFRGWYVEGDADETIITSIAPTDDVTLVAKWDVKYTLTVDYNKDSIADATIVYGSGDETAPVEPAMTDGQVFDYWYTLDGEQEVVYTAGTPITANTTIYAKWKDAVPYYGSYAGFETYGASGSGSFYGGKTIQIDAEGKVTGSKSGTVTVDATVNTGLKLDNYVAYHNPAEGIFIFNYGSNGTDLKNDIYGYILGATSVAMNSASTSTDQFVWNNGLSRVMRLKVTTADGDSVKYMIVDGNNAYLVEANNFVVTGISFNTSTAMTELKANGVKISATSVGGAQLTLLGDGSALLIPDAYMGTYTNASSGVDLVLDGAGNFTMGDVTGTYVEAEDGSAHTLVGTTMKNEGGTFYSVTYNFTLVGSTYTESHSQEETAPFAMTGEDKWSKVENPDGSITYTAQTSTASETFTLKLEALGAISIKVTFSQSGAQSNEYFALKKNGNASQYTTDAKSSNTTGFEDNFGEISYNTGNISGEITYDLVAGDYVTFYHADYTSTNSDVTTITITIL